MVTTMENGKNSRVCISFHHFNAMFILVVALFLVL